jgi:protein-S-isoprenylcysteine O-methyltransferase Ste14
MALVAMDGAPLAGKGAMPPTEAVSLLVLVLVVSAVVFFMVGSLIVLVVSCVSWLVVALFFVIVVLLFAVGFGVGAGSFRRAAICRRRAPNPRT